jgi:hypothetical protein
MTSQRDQAEKFLSYFREFPRGRMIYKGERDCPKDIYDVLTRIEESAGSGRASSDNPCGLIAMHIFGDERPWRIADDWSSDQFATAEEAAEAAEDWYD